ncbi:UDP-2,4-diacetamido-2,4,6-trideoxy-beta-L-altropyranose hydrolase [Gallaecimonas sp. GXIMD1310]|uniref:UDP-2,4-diacetamido-2,4, 6-trideoxy-beta-L-altropyranose hydrolase n=1 Tax=Gallaecimonas sp. GXIMD1310 TaxID=3131926 RepID=UPI00324CC9CC
MSNNSWIAIRADASMEIGSGHMMRTITLAQAARKRGVAVVFICRHTLDSMTKRLADLEIGLIRLPEHIQTEALGPYFHSPWLGVTEQIDAQDTLAALEHETVKRGVPPLRMIVDHYALAAPWEQRIAEICPILAIDDLNDRPHHVSWLLDVTLGKSPSHYAPLVLDSTKLLLGSRYALLRDEFTALLPLARAKSAKTQGPWRILVTLGGIDRDNKTMLILEALEKVEVNSALSICIVAGAANPHFDELEKRVQESQLEIELLRFTDQIGKLMLEADLCIGAAGSTSWERCALGLPTINIVLAANQEVVANNLKKAGVAINFGYLEASEVDRLAEMVSNLLNSKDKLESMSRIGQSQCDGHGVNRVLEAIGCMMQK